MDGTASSLNRGEDIAALLVRNWEWGPSILISKEWTVNFDPSQELVARNKVWSILPNLPLVFWTKESLETIGNNIGVFIRLEPNWFSKLDRRWAWIQVEVETSEDSV
jgi:hypothetical protein